MKPATFLPSADVDLDGLLLKLFNDALARIPEGTPAVSSVKRVRVRRQGATRGMVGLTKYSSRGSGKSSRGEERQRITFYTRPLETLSREAVIGVIAHELAHAWLNEHRSPEQSEAREREADAIAIRWGFKPEIDALALEGG